MVLKRRIPCLVLLCLLVCGGGTHVKGAIGPLFGFVPQAEVAMGPVTGVVPWPYGLILYLDVTPEQTASAVAAATWAVESVCRFWEIECPDRYEDWSEAPGREACCDEGMHPVAASMVLPRRPVRLPGPEESVLRWWRCPHLWGERIPLEPVILMVVSDSDSVSHLAGGRPYQAFFSRFRLHMDSYPADIPGPIIVMTQEDLLTSQAILLHEVTHWLFYDMMEKSLPGSRVRILREGSARLTEEKILGTDSYRAIAAIFAEEGNLSDVPRSLVYPIGASVAEVLWGAELTQIWGTHDPGEWTRGFTEPVGRSIQSSYWQWLAYVIEDAWRESLADVEVTAKDRAIYSAATASMGVVAWMLDPILNDEAREYANRLCAGDVPDFRVELFWELVGHASEGWEPNQVEQLAIRDSALASIALDNAIHVAPPAPEREGPDYDYAQYLIARLVGLREMAVWPLYFDEFVRLVRLYVAEGAVDPDLVPWWNPNPRPPETD